MGKTKHKHIKKQRQCPTGLVDLKDIEREEDYFGPNASHGSATGAGVQSVIDRLQSSNVEGKESAANYLANLASQPGGVMKLLEGNVIKAAAPLLLDKSFTVRHAVAGALRNISVDGGPDACQTMVDLDVMTPLVALLHEYNGDWHPVLSAESKIDSRSEIFKEAVHFLWNLCESSEAAVFIFNKQSLLPVLLNCLSLETFGEDIVIPVAQCLHTVSEENQEVISKLNEPVVLDSIYSLCSTTGEETANLLLKTLGIGIIVNIHSGQLAKCSPATVTLVMETINLTLTASVLERMKTLVEMIQCIKTEDKKKENIAELESKETLLTACARKLQDILIAKQIALEILTNILCSEDGDDWEDVGSSDTSEEMISDISMEEDSTAVGKFPVTIPCEVHEALVSQDLVNKVLDHTNVLSEEILSVLEKHKEGQNILKRVKTVRCRAFLCINNIAQGLDKEDLGSSQNLYNMWIYLAELAFKQTDSKDCELLEAATSAVRGILEKLGESGASMLFRHTTLSDLQLLFEFGRQCTDTSVLVNLVRIVGTLGCLLGTVPEDGTKLLTKNVGLFILEIIHRDSGLRTTAEALDAIFDVFGEDHLDPIAQEIGLVDKLRQFLPVLVAKIKHQKKSLGEHTLIIMTAKTNLVRFIQYKTKGSQNGHQ
ncbi:HEAT repeat-containing protein 3 [Tachypleus tridentatus]|uniref:HEAT repeat-containing protein 3 n=1 Tax=Tachypleus tridentatus TaxID=6853 RepID=UPI003FD09EDE